MFFMEILKKAPKGISRSNFDTHWIGQSTKLNSTDHCRRLLLPLFIYFILFFITLTHQSKIIC